MLPFYILSLLVKTHYFGPGVCEPLVNVVWGGQTCSKQFNDLDNRSMHKKKWRYHLQTVQGSQLTPNFSLIRSTSSFNLLFPPPVRWGSLDFMSARPGSSFPLRILLLSCSRICASADFVSIFTESHSKLPNSLCKSTPTHQADSVPHQNSTPC